MVLRLGSIVDVLGGDLHGDADLQVSGIASLEAATSDQLSFLSHPKYQGQLNSTRAGCVILSPEAFSGWQGNRACIVTPDPYLYFARVTQLWLRKTRPHVPPGVHPSAVVSSEAHVHSGAYVGPLCIVERGACIGEGTVLRGNVTVGENCIVGDRCLLHAGVVIGADGFGFAPNGKAWEKIEQLGAVRIGNDVEIGANTCIDRGALHDTVIDDGVKLDNLIQIGHNVHVGANTAMAGCVGIAGSATIGANCTIGGGAIVLGHLSLADGVHISAASVVTRSIRKPGQYTGLFPLDENASWEKNAASLKQLHGLRERIRALEEEVKRLENP